jgi:DNA-binding Xre family transcriptional regulator
MGKLHKSLSVPASSEGGLTCFLADLLYSSGLSLSAAARRIGKARTTLIRWKDNTAEEFEFETLARLCALFVYPGTADTSSAEPTHIPISLLLEYQPRTDQEKSRTIPVVQTLPVLPANTGRHQIICTLLARLNEEDSSYQTLARQLKTIQAETLSDLGRSRTSAISRHTLTLLCEHYGSIDRLFVFDPRALP